MMDTTRLDRRCIKKEYGMKASRKALLLGLMLAAGAGAAPTMGAGGGVVDIYLAPPPVRVEPPPPPRVGDVSGPGVLGGGGPGDRWGARGCGGGTRRVR